MKLIRAIIIILFSFSFTGCLFDKKTLEHEWTIGKYNIKEYSGLGLVGPRYYYFNLDKQNPVAALFYRMKKTYADGYSLSNCNLIFEKKGGEKLNFNICESPFHRKKLEYKNISTIEVIRIDSMSVKSVLLNYSQQMYFINSFNKTKKYSKGSPHIKYLIKVTEDYNQIRTFNSDGIYIFEQTNNAKFAVKDTTFFKTLFK